jgi:SAM-dependent methyltransferase
MADLDIPRVSGYTTHISQKRGQFRYFDHQLGFPDWPSMTVLDFGGNIGNFLDDAGPRIAPERYWCLDVAAEAIEIGRRRHPLAHWVSYDLYNCCFNPAGKSDLKLPEFDRTFDCILAYSVFTHVLPSEMQALVAQLVSRLADGGRLAFTFIDPEHESWPERPGCNNLQWRLERMIAAGAPVEVTTCLDRTKGANWFALVNEVDLYVEDEAIPLQRDGPRKSFHVFHSASFMHRLFGRSTIREPVSGEMQHCCILGR